MALIKCTECGKEFSDKAAACPNCGCPTSEVQKPTEALASNAGKARKSKEADAAISAAVKKTQREADAADRDFDRTSDRIQEKASKVIDLFGGDAPQRLTEIAADARRACDDLYSTYQTLIPLLDATCRPLLTDMPSKEAVKSVAECIKYLNDESEIEKNFGLTFNSDNLGNVASAKYVPRMENKIIQKFWESQIYSSPTLAEITKKFETPEERTARLRAEEDRKKAEIERIRAEEEQKRVEEERKRAEEEKKKSKLENDRRQYEQDLKNWESECSQVNGKRNDYVKDQLAKEKERIVFYATKERDEVVQKANLIIEEQTKCKSSAEALLPTLGVLKLGEKKKQKSIIEYAAKAISEANASILAAQSRYSAAISQAESNVKAKTDVFRKAAERQYPIPLKPSKPSSVVEAEEEERLAALYPDIHPSRRKNELKKDAIIKSLRQHNSMTISDMIETIPELKEATYQHISALCRQLVTKRKILKYSDHRMIRYKINNSD